MASASETTGIEHLQGREPWNLMQVTRESEHGKTGDAHLGQQIAVPPPPWPAHMDAFPLSLPRCIDPSLPSCLPPELLPALRAVCDWAAQPGSSPRLAEHGSLPHHQGGLCVFLGPVERRLACPCPPTIPWLQDAGLGPRYGGGSRTGPQVGRRVSSQRTVVGRPAGSQVP